MKKFYVTYADDNAFDFRKKYRTVSYTCETSDDAVERFKKYHGKKNHYLKDVREADPVYELSVSLGRMLLPRR